MSDQKTAKERKEFDRWEFVFGILILINLLFSGDNYLEIGEDKNKIAEQGQAIAVQNKLIHEQDERILRLEHTLLSEGGAPPYPAHQ